MKILWPFDPFDKNKKLCTFGKILVNTLFDKRDSFEVAYVASNAEVGLATAYDIPIKERYNEFPKKMIQEQLKDLSLTKTKINILSEKNINLTSSVSRLVKYSAVQKIDLIVLATNAKKFLPRLIFGSFAETLVHLSLCDLLIYHQKTKFKETRPKSIIYAHDMTQKGTQGLESVIKYVKKWNCCLTIIHVPIPELGIEPREFELNTEKKLNDLEKYLKKQEIKFVIHFESGPKSVPELVIKMAKKTNADIIALTAQSKKFKAFLGGSVTRQVLRESILPILVLKV